MEHAQIKIEYPGKDADAALKAIEEMNTIRQAWFGYVINNVTIPNELVIWTEDVDDIYKLGLCAAKHRNP